MMRDLCGIMVVGTSTLDVFLRGGRMPESDEQIPLLDYQISPGGSGLNTSVALSFLKVPVVLATRVGADTAGALIRELLEAQQIRSGQVIEDPVQHTSFSLVNVAEDGQIGLLHHEGANTCLSLEDISAAEMGNCDTVHLAGAMSLQRLDGEPAGQLMKAARALGKKISLSTSRLTARAATLGPVLPYLDLIFTNRKEAFELTGCQDYPSAAAWFRERGVRGIVITLGRNGAYVSSPDFSGEVSALPVHAVDTTGCGDAFVAGFLYAARCGLSTEACAFWGNALGSHCARTLGALVSPFGTREIEAMLEKGKRFGGLAAFVLAGGASRRMEGAEQKLILEVGGRPLIAWVVEALRRTGVHRIALLLGHRASAVESALRGQPVEFFKAADFSGGTGSSVREALKDLGDLPDNILVVNGDTPLLRAETLSWLIERHFDSRAAATAVTAQSTDTGKYSHGIILRDPDGAFSVGHFTSSGARGISHEVNTGTYCFRRDDFRLACNELRATLDGKEHLSDVLAVLRASGRLVNLELHPDFSQFISANTREDLKEIEELLRQRLRLEE